MRYMFGLMLICLASCVVHADDVHPDQDDSTDNVVSDDWLPQVPGSGGPEGCAPFFDAEGRPIPTLCDPFYIDKGYPDPDYQNPSEKFQMPGYQSGYQK